jgi:hypothetical protein
MISVDNTEYIMAPYINFAVKQINNASLKQLYQAQIAATRTSSEPRVQTPYVLSTCNPQRGPREAKYVV